MSSRVCLLLLIALACRTVPAEEAPSARVEVDAERLPEVDSALVDVLAEALRAASLGDASLATFVRTWPDHAAALVAGGGAEPPIDDVRRHLEAGPGPALALVRATLDGPVTHRSWTRALAACDELCVPALGSAVLAAKPADAPWPASLGWADADAFRLHLARQHVRRREARAALDVLPEEARGAAALLRARLLVLLGAEEEGRAVLTTLLAEPEDDVRCGALVTLAALAARDGELEVARAAYERALETPAWSGRERALSDLGLLSVQLGLRDDGAAELESARLALCADGDALGAFRSLRAEAAWRASVGEVDAARELEVRARELVREAGLLPD